MKRTKFSRWLDKQRNRPRPGIVGDLARDAHGEIETYGLEGPQAWLDYLDRRGACEGALKACRQAWVEFSAEAAELET